MAGKDFFPDAGPQEDSRESFAGYLDQAEKLEDENKRLKSSFRANDKEICEKDVEIKQLTEEIEKCRVENDELKLKVLRLEAVEAKKKHRVSVSKKKSISYEVEASESYSLQNGSVV